jgi:virulence-associated protein VagC
MNNAITATAKVIDDGEYQIVNLPEDFQFDAEAVWVQKIGDALLLSPISKTENFVPPTDN